MCDEGPPCWLFAHDSSQNLWPAPQCLLVEAEASRAPEDSSPHDLGIVRRHGSRDRPDCVARHWKLQNPLRAFNLTFSVWPKVGVLFPQEHDS